MNRFLIALAWVGLFAGAAGAQEKKFTIRWFGQSFFQITTTAGTRIVIDPHAIEQYPRNIVPADVVLITHPHLDHSTLTPIENRDKAKVIAGIKVMGRRQEWNNIDEKFRDAQIKSVGLYHDKESGMARGRNTAFLIEVDGLRICHLGDLGHELSDRQVQAIGQVDILMIPVGGIYTINGTDATKLDITSGTGSCSVTATKAADADYNSATSPANAVTISKASQGALLVTAPSDGTEHSGCVAMNGLQESMNLA